MTEQHFKDILSKYYPRIKFFKSEDDIETWVYPWKTPEEKYGFEKLSFFNYPRNKYVLLNRTSDYPYRFPNNYVAFECWVAEQAEKNHSFYCGGFTQLDKAPCCVRELDKKE